MIFRVESHHTSFITREELQSSEWSEKLDRFINCTGFNDETALINALKLEYNLSDEQTDEIEKCLKNETIKYFRYFNSKYEHFKIEPVYLPIKSVEGKLIYWKDWDYIFQQVGHEYLLWCFLGGIADAQREIKLSDSQVKKYKEIGFAQIEYLIDDLKKLNDSIEYKSAVEENRSLM